MNGAIRKPKAEQAMLDQIVAGAERAFLAGGYDLTTMDTVARHAGVARASVYNNFKGKEALFLAVMRRGVAGFVARALGEDDPAASARERLRRSAITFLRAATEPESIEMYRTVVSQAARFPELSETLYAQGLARIGEEFRRLADLAGLPAAAVVAEQLLATLMGGFFGPRLLGVAGPETPEAYVDRALSALLPRPEN